MKREQATLGVSAVVRLRRQAHNHVQGETGIITRQAPAGTDRYQVLFPGDPMSLYLRPADLELVQGIELAETGWWWQRNGPECAACPHRRFGGLVPGVRTEDYIG